MNQSMNANAKQEYWKIAILLLAFGISPFIYVIVAVAGTMIRIGKKLGGLSMINKFQLNIERVKDENN